MMPEKGSIVLESGDDWATILTVTGEYKKIKTKKRLYPGEIYNEEIKRAPVKLCAAAAIFLIILIGTIDFFNITAYARLSSGVEMGLNRWDRVVSIEATEVAGEEILTGLNLLGQKADTALEQVVTRTIDVYNSKGEDSNEISLSIEASGNKKVIKKDLQEKFNKFIKASNKRRNEIGINIKDKDKIDIIKDDIKNDIKNIRNDMKDDVEEDIKNDMKDIRNNMKDDVKEDIKEDIKKLKEKETERIKHGEDIKQDKRIETSGKEKHEKILQDMENVGEDIKEKMPNIPENNEIKNNIEQSSKHIKQQTEQIKEKRKQLLCKSL